MGLALGYRRPFVRAIRLAARAMAFGHTRGPFFYPCATHGAFFPTAKAGQTAVHRKPRCNRM